MIIERLLSGFERRSVEEVIQQARQLAVFGTSTALGGAVTERTALEVPAVLAAVRVLAESVASLPLVLYERLERGKRRATEQPLYRVLHDTPNPVHSAFEFREILQASLLLHGNGYAQIVRGPNGSARELWPLDPTRMAVRVDESGAPVYVYRTDVAEVEIPRENVLHVRGLAVRGFVGLSPIQLAREAIGTAKATELYASSLFANSARPSGVLEYPGRLSPEARRRLREAWEELHRGPYGAGRVAILEEGMTWKTVGIPPEDAQFLETRRFQVSEIARIFRVPPHMIGDLERATFSNIEQQAIDFVVHSLRPWLVRWEQAISRDVLTERERERFFPEFVVEGLLRGDVESRFRAYAIGRQWGWLSLNEIRERENLNPIEAGDSVLMPLNMVSVPIRGASAVAAANGGRAAAERSSSSHGCSSYLEPGAGAASPPPRAHPVRGLELRDRRVAAARRHELAADVVPVYEATAARVVRAEAREVRKLLKRLGEAPASDYPPALRELYAGLVPLVAESLRPTHRSYVRQLARALREELGAEVIGDPDRLALELAEAAGRMYALRSERAIVRAVRRREGEAAAAVEEVIDRWLETKPPRVARREAVLVANASAQRAFADAGRAWKVWTTFADTCPLCTRLDGATAPVDGAFLTAGDQAEGEGRTPVGVYRELPHPPLHRGCDCMIVAA